jgi:hypothetical protein
MRAVSSLKAEGYASLEWLSTYSLLTTKLSSYIASCRKLAISHFDKLIQTNSIWLTCKQTWTYTAR